MTISAWQGGLGPGLLATALASALCAFHYFPPIGSLAVSNPNDIARMAAFVFDGILTSFLMEWLHWPAGKPRRAAGAANEFKEASRRTEERFRAIIDNTDALIFMKNTKAGIRGNEQKTEGDPWRCRREVAGLSDHDVFPKAVAEAIRGQRPKRLPESQSHAVRASYPLG